MLEDIAPAIRPLKEVKVLSSANCIQDEELCVDSKISFLPFINSLKEKLAVTSDMRSEFYKYLIQKFEAEPALLKPIEDARILNENQDLLELLTTTLFPLVSDKDDNIFSLAVPYQYSIFNYSKPFGNLFVDEGEGNFMLAETESPEFLKRLQCTLVYEHALEKFYNIKLNENTHMIYPVVDKGTGMKKFYKLRYDRRFIDIHLKGELPIIQDCGVCMNTFRILDLDKQMEKMPLSIFAVEGFALWIAEDVTTQESLEAIKRALLSQETCDTTIINELKRNIHALIGLNDVEVGLTPFVKLNDEFVLDETCTIHGIVGKKWKTSDKESLEAYQMCLGILKEHPEPTPISNLNEQMGEGIPLLKTLYDQGVRSYIICPIQNNDGLLGLLEVTSPIPNLFNMEVMSRIEPALPLLSIALLKNRNTFNERIEQLIKQNFTALQPCVEWKFAEVAWEHMLSNYNKTGHVPMSGNVIFDNVYPLYGAIDVRNSSVERGYAIQKDLKEHLDLIDRTLDELQSQVKLPLLDGLKFKIQKFRLSIEKGMIAEDEIRINEFFEKDLTSIFSHLQKSNNNLHNVVEKYFNHVNELNGYLYRYRNEYENTMAVINEAVLGSLKQEEEAIQESYPHYFEKYRTDGVEYTIYIGQSIAPNNTFDLMYLQNLRLWQLKSMAEVARITNKLLPSLKVPLKTTQLILIHSQPISISFRKDERRFDVEGAYNIRYEIMKKRLDKVHIQGTDERLTQPGKIAMVYSNPKEAQEYQEYIIYLQSTNLLKPGLEFLELEELQGVRGLKALRVDINLDEDGVS